ncbi:MULTISPECIES: D-glycero-alpha-D-manno-heptose-1,7-bisphosphate 7-phosphatase [Bacillus]|uniref:D,D-heptose 1,7-bisphosphate phosphatase n=1 Tax=Bacillus wiedmannii TaxID=1890302 RepID=A0A242ZDD6_9BACI|nr:HAD-IIIA family hydrolase [Bacillus wiedmannii]MED3127002.1 HAD-IIIA family hydrolase [Bacillus wiedmannii]OTX90955.1 histidinol phosphate phosphatase [Bacillus wiedmannii]OUB50963.1 histidinol phosphate phosphatase [Bacillus thuringiensis serovar argentinensis]
MKAVFIDRDGTIGGTGRGIHPNEFTLFDFAPKAIQKLNYLGLRVFLYTNQTRIGRGYFTEKELLKGFQKMQQILKDEDVYIAGMYYCPHKMNNSCDCQNPNIGLLLKAAEEHDLCLKECFLIGDTGSTDMIAAERANMKKILVRTGWGESSLTKYRNSWKETVPDYIAQNLLDAVCWIENNLNT